MTLGKLARIAALLLFVLGTAAFLFGGSRHPHIGPHLGPLGSDLFFIHFAEHVHMRADWQFIHGFILVGPLFWLLGIALVTARPETSDARPWSQLARVSATLCAALWTVTFICDGFIAPIISGTVVDAGSPTDRHLAITQFAANQTMVIRAGLVGWCAIGVAVLALSLWMFARGRRSKADLALILAGVVLGIWPVVAWATRFFDPGPFISPLWNPTAILTSLWFLMFGIAHARAERAEPTAGGAA